MYRVRDLIPATERHVNVEVDKAEMQRNIGKASKSWPRDRPPCRIGGTFGPIIGRTGRPQIFRRPPASHLRILSD